MRRWRYGRENSWLSRRVVPVQSWLRRRGLPYIHGCLWDRECRFYDAPPRISLHVAGRMYAVDLPVPWPESVSEPDPTRDDTFIITGYRWTWHRPHAFVTSRRPESRS